MSQPLAPDPARARSGDGHPPVHDWESIERSEEFQELVRRRRAFVIPATIFFLAWYMGFILLCGYAEDFMAESVYEGLTVGYCLALTQFVMVFVLGLWYLRKADREFDPLAQRVVSAAGDDGGEKARAAERRFAAREAENGRDAAPAGTAPRDGEAGR
jgi:uncharacterized membrane protein (DUF485 family)